MGFLASLFSTPLPSITATELDQKLANQEAVLVLDVREPDEYQSGHIEAASLIPLGELQARMNELSKDKPII